MARKADIQELDAALRRLEEAYHNMPPQIASVALTFIHERFRQENWVDHRTEPWKRRKMTTQFGVTPRNNRKLLIDTGNMKRSIRKEEASVERVVIATDVPYARVHNDGFRGAVKQQVRAHRRRTQRYGEVEVKKHSRTIHQNIPRRRFMAQSVVLTKMINREIESTMIKALRR